MSTHGPPPRRIVTINGSASANDNSGSWEPAVTIVEEEIPRVSLLQDQAAKYPIFTHMQVPVDANEPWKSPEAQADAIPHQGVNVQFLDLAPGARVPLHRTISVDYMIFLSGEVILGVPDKAYDASKGEAPLIRRITCRPGDVVVQRGTLHYWENPSQTIWARYVGVGVRSQPLKIAIENENTGHENSKWTRELQPAWYS
ncbi:hypothetical protein PFICI_08955 [Pestalotiopsis fici W106-1]|uniref:Cupin type-1 domain-containing protein n=1 Tax=Pestalotiopsis fici (strain W106-1 / CGMCC3.15140) TaxID=1229662 RepID=W3X125_PESFW|nr:uncharacterized protein PFICI_08955 [Pestalotiopsis fici W106-1]ETS79102.1 hypothetical protein PFICI_08955 [Pestalotiopsis fici W106-1]